MHSKKSLVRVFFVLIICMLSINLYAATDTSISGYRYVAGGIIGTYPGFGIGHAIIGQYDNRGKYFLYAELASFGLIMAGSMSCFASNLYWRNCDEQSSGTISSQLIQVGLSGYAIAKVWEAIDVWTYGYGLYYSESNRPIKEQPNSGFILVPFLDGKGLLASAIYSF